MSQEPRNLLSGVIIAKDNEATIGDTIISLKPYCGNIIVADTGSTDKTPQIASMLGATVFFTSWNNDFSEARNFALSHVISPWVISIDTDEVLSKFDANEFIKITMDDSIGGINLIIRNLLSDGTESKHRYTRIFRVEKSIRFEGKIHEQINNSLTNAGFSIYQSDFEIYHTGYAESSESKNDRNIGLLNDELSSNPGDDFTLYHLAQSYFAAKDTAKSKELFETLANSMQITQIQRDNVNMRLAQIALDANDFEKVLLLTESISNDADIGGLQMLLRALAYLYLKNFSSFQLLITNKRLDESGLVNVANLEKLREIAENRLL